MATKKSSSSQRKTSSGAKKNTANQKTRHTSKEIALERERAESFRQEILLWIIVAVSLLLFISNFGIGGSVGGAVSSFLFGLFGLLAYIIPILILVGSFFIASNKGNTFATVKIIAAVLFVLFLCMFISLVVHGEDVLTPVKEYRYCAEKKIGGGFFGACFAYLLCKAFGQIGAYIIDVVVLIVCTILITEKSAMRGMKKGGKKVYESALEAHEYRMQERESRRMDRKVTGVAADTKILDEETEASSDEMNEIHPRKFELPEVIEEKLSKITTREEEIPFEPEYAQMQEYASLDHTKVEVGFSEEDFVKKLEQSFEGTTPAVSAKTSVSLTSDENQASETNREEDFQELQKELKQIHKEFYHDDLQKEEVLGDGFHNESLFNEDFPDNDFSGEELLGMESQMIAEGMEIRKPRRSEAEIQQGIEEVAMQVAQEVPVKKYIFPPITLLKMGAMKKNGNSQEYLRETAMKLQNTLQTFGVNVTVTDISCGPSVTRYEIQPEMGVKVSKIVNLADDIKLNLAAADIRIEAPIPGKAAVGIEVPNKENVVVSFRELIESNEFQNAKSNISFAVGRDIAGNINVADIGKMPHLLIAGATGSGKSVCINTIIMSILYKADPNKVKLIMIDPKVVELSVYNGIPHLMIPVVTDPKKAAGALNWAVEEMTDRYQKFAEAGVRKFDEYNAKISKIQVPEGQEPPKEMPQILIIVDELADLMMVASHDVEDAICRLAQLARAAGIHLVIATQRPSVNVITGLIKANMPSRIAFAVTSGIDSRTILDMNGAEKLLGKGDMLFHPQGVPKPIRVQGAFVSDDEVSAVVGFLKEHNGSVEYSSDVQQKMEHLENSGGQTVAISDGDVGDGRDSYFQEAAQIIVDKEKASIGMLQRYLKVGFNRAARIMDQLEEAGIVGPEEGTKPRKVLMTPEEFQQFIDGNRET